MPALKKRTINPVPRTDQLLFNFISMKNFLSNNKTYYSQSDIKANNLDLIKSTCKITSAVH
jgi:hypothetical protein